jgi:hypothetical protein
MKTLNFIPFLFSFMVLFGSAYSATITTNATGGAWNEPSTWAGNIVPTENDDVIISATVTVNGVSYSSRYYKAKNVTVQPGGKIIREDIGGHSALVVGGNLLNNGEITDNADYFDISIGGNFENNGIFRPRHLTMVGTNVNISGSYQISSKTFQIKTVNNELLAKSNLHFHNCDLTSYTKEHIFNLDKYALTLSSDQLIYDSYYNKILSKCNSNVVYRFSATGEIKLNKAILLNKIEGDVIFKSDEFGILNGLSITGDLTIDNNARIVSYRNLTNLNVSGNITNFGNFCADTLMISEKTVAPLSLKLIASGNVINNGNFGNINLTQVTNGNQLVLEGDFSGKVVLVQSENSEKPGGKVVINSELNLYGELDIYADLEITKTGILNLHYDKFGPLYVNQNDAKIINNGTLKLNHYVNDSWNYNSFSDDSKAASVNIVLRDWESRIENINIEVHNNQNYSGLPATVKRWWRIKPVGSGKVEGYTAKFYYDESLLNGQTEENLKVYQSTDNGETWKVISVGEYCEINTEENYISIGYWAKPESLLTEFGDFVISAGDGSVPIESNIKLDLVGRSDIRIGAPNPWTVHVYNLTDRNIEPVLVTVNVTEDIRFKEARIPFGDSIIVLPVDSMGNADDLTQVFFIPFMAPNEHISFDVIVYGLTENTKSATNDVPTITAGGLTKDFAKGKVEEYLIEEFINKKLELCEQNGEAEAYRKAMNLTVDQYKIKKQTYSAPVEAFRHVAKDFGTKVIEVFPGGKIITTVGNTLEKVAAIKDNLRRRMFNWFYKEIGLIKDEDIQVKTGKQVKGKMVSSWDPNEIVGPSGFGDQNFMSSIPTMHYTIFFENKKEATAPAYRVQIIDTLSAAFNPETVQFLQTSHSGTQYKWKMERNGNILKWDIEGIELPPNANPPEGEGWVRFSVELNQNVKHADVIENRATIIFDMNEPITTNTWINTLDFEAPVTTMQPIIHTMGDSLATISCAVDDKDGAGVNSVSFFVSKNGGMFEEIGLSSENEIIYNIGDTVGNNFRFYAISTDNVENMEKSLPVFVEINTVPTAIDAMERSQKISVYPNPTSGEITIDSSELNKFTYEIFSLTGKKLLEGQNQFSPTTKVDLSELSPGTYFLKIETGKGEVEVHKILRNR